MDLLFILLCLNMDYNKIKDAVFKKAMEIFKDGATEFFDFDLKIIV